MVVGVAGLVGLLLMAITLFFPPSLLLLVALENLLLMVQVHVAALVAEVEEIMQVVLEIHHQHLHHKEIMAAAEVQTTVPTQMLEAVAVQVLLVQMPHLLLAVTVATEPHHLFLV